MSAYGDVIAQIPHRLSPLYDRTGQFRPLLIKAIGPLRKSMPMPVLALEHVTVADESFKAQLKWVSEERHPLGMADETTVSRSRVVVRRTGLGLSDIVSVRAMTAKKLATLLRTSSMRRCLSTSDLALKDTSGHILWIVSAEAIESVCHPRQHGRLQARVDYRGG
nr:hypothetical protein CFP56_04142 [Quercus suber]